MSVGSERQVGKNNLLRILQRLLEEVERMLDFGLMAKQIMQWH